MNRLILAIALATLFATSATWGQSNTTPSNGGSQGEGGSQAQVASVGAGTASAVTTGSSGPDQGSSLGPGELPPLPSAELCSDYEGQPAYAACLAVVLAD